MYNNEVYTTRVIEEVKQAIYVDFGIVLNMGIMSTMYSPYSILEIRWSEGTENYQASKSIEHYPVTNPPEYAWRDTSERIVNELRQQIKDTRMRRADKWKNKSTNTLNHIAVSYFDDTPATPDECFEQKTTKIILLC